jgi:hypothetical protein
MLECEEQKNRNKKSIKLLLKMCELMGKQKGEPNTNENNGCLTV